MTMAAYYNEIDPYAAQWLRNLISAGHIAPSDVDERSIINVKAADLKGYTQFHFFARIGGWSYALRLAGWPDNRPVWTGSCPCQPFSSAGKQEGQSDVRHLWPHWFRLIRECHPATIFGEQVAGAITFGWLDEVFNDLEKEAYACAPVVLPACAVGAPHKRERLWFVANANSKWKPQPEGSIGEVRGRFGNSGAIVAYSDSRWGWPNASGGNNATGENAGGTQANVLLGKICDERTASALADSNGSNVERVIGGGYDQKIRKEQKKRPAGLCDGTGQHCGWEIEPRLGRVAHGVSARTHKLRAYGNAIVPQVAAEFIKAYLSCDNSDSNSLVDRNKI